MKLDSIHFAEFRLDAENLHLREAVFDAKDGMKVEGVTYGDFCAIAFGAQASPGWPCDMPVFVRLPPHCHAYVERIAGVINSIMAEASANAATVANLSSLSQAAE